MASQWMHVYNGGYFEPLSPDVSDIDPEVVAHHIGKAQRYAGAPDDDYTVAEHSFHVSKCLERDGYGVRIAMQGHIHDAPEFAFGDQIRPLKNAIRAAFPEAYDFMEQAHDRVGEMLAMKWGAGWPFDPAVKLYDNRIISDEIPQLFPGSPWNSDLAPLGVELQNWDWRIAKYQWLERFTQLQLRLERGEQ